MKKSRLISKLCAGIGLMLAFSVSQAATISIDPTDASAPANGTVNFSFVGSDFSMGDGAFDLTYDPNVLTYNGDFAFDAGLTPRDSFFDIIDDQAPGLLSIGWTSGFGPALVFPAPPGRLIGSLSFTMNANTNPGDFSDLTMADSVKWSGFADDTGAPIDMLYVGGMATTVVPVPAAVWLFASGLLGLVGVARRKQAA